LAVLWWTGHLLAAAGSARAQVAAGTGVAVEVEVYDPSHQPVPGVQLTWKLGGAVVTGGETGAQGSATFQLAKAGQYTLTAVKEGFQPLTKSDLEVAPGSATVELTLVERLSQHETVEVEASVPPVEQGASTPTKLPPEVARELPSRPANVAEALPLVPGVVRKPDGALQISGSAEHRSSLIVNSADVSDPATGQFGLTVPIDSVETLNVYQTPYMAEYGRFTAGLVSVETRRGGEKWKWELNDPFPDFYVRSWHLRGLRDATPRLNVEGPIVPGKLYLSEGLEYEVRKIEIYTLPFPLDQKRNWGVNSFAQLDWVASSRHLLTVTAHVAPQHMEYANLDYFNPMPTTPDAATANYTVTISDRLTLWGGLLENTISGTRFDANVWGQGPAGLTISPLGNGGNYFAQQYRVASRVSWLPSLTFHPSRHWGTHNYKIGSYIAYSADRGQMDENSIQVLNTAYRLTESIDFSPSHGYTMTDTEYAFYGEDHWVLSSRLALDLGARTESQEVSESFRFAPRAGFAYTPIKRTGTVLRGGFGFFYDHVPLNVYAFEHYPRQTQTFYDGEGNIIAGPYSYANALSEVNVHVPFVHHELAPGDFSPRSDNTSLELDQPLGEHLQVRLAFIQSEGAGLVVMVRQAPDPVTGIGAFDVTGAGSSRYRQWEATARWRLTDKRQLFFSYVRSGSSGDVNDFNNYLGSFPVPIIRDNQSSTLPGDLPNRFLTWGLWQLPHGWRIAPVVEFRSGFPYSSFDAAQAYVGRADGYRYPNFFSLDSRIAKDIAVTPKYKVRLSLSSFNLTNHFNPEAVHYNIADPEYGLFFGERHRRFTVDFDVLF
jgi:hypothetical protein